MDVEVDTLDALSILGRASSVSMLEEILGNLYVMSDPVTGEAMPGNVIDKCLTRLLSFGCIEKIERDLPGMATAKRKIITYRITDKGKEAFNESLDALEARMKEMGGRGIRRDRKRSQVSTDNRN